MGKYLDARPSPHQEELLDIKNWLSYFSIFGGKWRHLSVFICVLSLRVKTKISPNRPGAIKDFTKVTFLKTELEKARLGQ